MHVFAIIHEPLQEQNTAGNAGSASKLLHARGTSDCFLLPVSTCWRESTQWLDFGEAAIIEQTRTQMHEKWSPAARFMSERVIYWIFWTDEKPCCTLGIRYMCVLCQTAGIIFVQWQKHEFLPLNPFELTGIYWWNVRKWISRKIFGRKLEGLGQTWRQLMPLFTLCPFRDNKVDLKMIKFNLHCIIFICCVKSWTCNVCILF